MMDWNELREFSTETAYTVFAVPALYTPKGAEYSFAVETVFNEQFEVTDEAGLTHYKPVAKIKFSDIPEPTENGVLQVNGKTLLVDYYRKHADSEWVLYLKEQAYGSY